MRIQHLVSSIYRILALSLFATVPYRLINVSALQYFLVYPQERTEESLHWLASNFILAALTHSFRPYHGPGVDSAPSENEYQEYFLGVKAVGAWGWQPPTFMCRMSWNLGA